MFNLTHKTENNQIEALGREELKDLLVAEGNDPKEVNRMKKDERVAAVKVIRDEMIEQEAAKEAAKEAARLEQLAIDREDATFNAVKVAYLKSVNAKYTKAEEKLEAMKTKIADGTIGEMVWTMRNYLDDAIEYAATIRMHTATRDYLMEQIEEPTHTKEQFVYFNQQHADQLLDNVLTRSDYRHSSTSGISNIEGQIDFKVMQEAAKFYRNAVKYVAMDLESGKTDAGAMKSGYIMGW